MFFRWALILPLLTLGCIDWTRTFSDDACTDSYASNSSDAGAEVSIDVSIDVSEDKPSDVRKHQKARAKHKPDVVWHDLAPLVDAGPVPDAEPFNPLVPPPCHKDVYPCYPWDEDKRSEP